MARLEALELQPMSTSRQILMNVYWFSINVVWISILLIIMPSYIESVVGDLEKGKVLGIVLGIVAAVSMLFAPLFGAFSDRIRLPGGRRKPWMVIGTCGVVVTLAVLFYCTRLGDISSLPGWIASLIILEFFSNMATAPYSALIPDLVSFRQRGSAIGWLSLMTMLGYFGGTLVGVLTVPLGMLWVYLILVAVLLGGLLVIVFGVEEPNVLPETSPFAVREFLYGLFTPFKHFDFSWVFFNRLLVAMGSLTIQEFALYYMADGFGSVFILPLLGKITDTPEGATSIFFAAVFLGATATSLVSGVLSDKYGRKPLAYTGTLMLGVMCMIFTFSHSFFLSILMGIVFGMGYGIYDTTAWALAVDVLPSADDRGKDMGIRHMSLMLPRIIATPIAGFLLDHFQALGTARNIPHMGYTIIFVIAVVYFILGSMCLKQIKAIR